MIERAKYEIRVIDHRTGDILRIYSLSQLSGELRYGRVLNGIGRVAFTMLSFPEQDEVFSFDNIVEIWRLNSDTPGEDGVVRREKDASYLIRMRLYFTDEGVSYITIGGVSLEHLLMRRVIHPGDDPNEAGGYSTKLDIASDMMAEYATEQIGSGASADRSISTLTVSSDGSGDTIGGRYRYENLMSVLKELGTKGRVDFRISNDGRDLLLEFCQIGSDKSVGGNGVGDPVTVFSPARGNLDTPVLTIDREEEANFIYMQSEGEAGNQTVMEVFNSYRQDTNWNRFEVARKANGNQRSSALDLRTEALETLVDGLPKTSFEYRVVTDAEGGRYNVDWQLGDTVTVKWDAFQDDIRIRNVEITVSENGEDIQVTVERDRD
jgi:hypothetical protein